MAPNTLYYGDNLDILRRYVADESVDLIYLDPPFNSNANYNVLFKEKDGTKAASQIRAFDDTWEWTLESKAVYNEVVAGGGKVSDALIAFEKLLGPNDMLAYLTMMAPRLVEMRRVLKSTGSLYLHCDPTASHYLKVLLDAVFGADRMLSEVAWQRTSAHSKVRRFGPVHDVIFFHSKSPKYTWNDQFAPYDEEYIRGFYHRVEQGTERRFRLDNITSSNPGGSYLWKGNPPPYGRYWGYSLETMERFEREGRLVYSKAGIPSFKRYLDEMPGRKLQDVWVDVPPISSKAAERLGYPTQKPEALLERIISASSNEGDVVLDPFCGCGTTIAAAQKLGRRWIGIDVTYVAISLIKKRLQDRFRGEAQYETEGLPRSAQDAEELALHDRHLFERWALDLVQARPNDNKRGADKGIDGRIRFNQAATGYDWTEALISVKSGTVHAHDVRDLRGVVEREKAALGVLITLQEPTKPMQEEAIAAGFYAPPYNENLKSPRIQILTVKELLAGKQIECTTLHHTADTFSKAPRHRAERQVEMEMGEE